MTRLRHWRAIRKVRPVDEEGAVQAGREGETWLAAMLGNSYDFQGARVIAGRRIPSRRQGRRREVDLIVCTPRMIHLIEVKNWSGRVERNGGSWRQTRRGGAVVDHSDLIEENRLRREAVAEYLGEHGARLDERTVRERIVPKVIFTNPRLELDPVLEGRADVISRRELDGFLGVRPEGSWAGRLSASLVALCVQAESRAPGGGPEDDGWAGIPYERVVAALSSAPTWDRLHLYGTKVVTGDLVGVRVGLRTISRGEIEAQAGGLPLRLRWTRGRFLGLFKALTGLGCLGRLYLGKTGVDVTPDDVLSFHAVGEADPCTRSLAGYDRVELG